MSEKETSALTSASSTAVLDSDAFDPASLQDWHKDVKTEQKSLMRVAFFVLIFVVGFGGVWSFTAKIGGAVIASGRVVAEGRNRVVQHLEGGIIDQITVKEGDTVKKGQTLAVLDATQVQSQLKNSEIQEAILLITKARREAEVAGASAIQFPEIEGDTLREPKVQDALINQQTEFDAIRAQGQSEIDILKANIAAERETLKINATTRKSLNEQLVFLEERLEGQRELDEAGYSRKDILVSLEIQVIDTRTQVQNLILEDRRIEQTISSLERQIEQIGLEYKANAASQLVELSLQLNETSEALTRLRDISTRGTIVAPVDGTVFRIATTTLGAVIQPGDTLFEIFPEGEGLRLEATVQVQDIEQVRVGQKANIVFPSNKGQALEPLYGEVTYISTDTIVTEQAPNGYYLAYVTLDAAATEQPILPGNSAEVYLQTTPKTLIQYITEPITRFAGRVFTG